MNKEEIFDNLPEFTAQDLFKYIRQGVVTLPELKDPHNVDEPMKASVRKELEDLLENAEPNDWSAALKEDSIRAYQDYLNQYPEGSHRQEARNAISRLKTQSAKWKLIFANLKIKFFMIVSIKKTRKRCKTL